MDGLKILSLSTYDISGGAAKAAYRIHSGVRAMGVDSIMFVKDKQSNDDSVYALNDLLPSHPLYKMADWTANKCKNKWQHYQWNKYPHRKSYYMSDLRSTWFNNALKKIDYDVLHLHWINQRFFPLQLLHSIKKPIVWTLHDSWPFCGVCHYFLECDGYKKHCGACPHLVSTDEHDLSWKIWRKKQEYYKGLDLHVVTPSNWLAECARASSLLGNFPITVIPNALDTDIFNPVDRKVAVEFWHKNSGKKYLLYGAVNALRDEIKGFKQLCEALKIFVATYDRNDVELVVFGADKPIDELNIGMPVSYMGYIKDEKELAKLYSLADVMVVPSLTENLSCTIMESLACGTPVVAFSIGGNGDMLQHKVNGWLANDVYSMAEGINYVLSNREKLDCRHEIANVVQQMYSIKNVAEHYKNLYCSLC